MGTCLPLPSEESLCSEAQLGCKSICALWRSCQVKDAHTTSDPRGISVAENLALSRAFAKLFDCLVKSGFYCWPHTHVLCGHVKDKLVTEQASLPRCLFTCVRASLSAQVMPMPGPFNRSWKKLGVTPPSAHFLLLPPSFLFKFKWAPCSFKAVYFPANVMVFMIVRREQSCSVCLLPDVPSELSVSAHSEASQLQGEVGV